MDERKRPWMTESAAMDDKFRLCFVIHEQGSESPEDFVPIRCTMDDRF